MKTSNVFPTIIGHRGASKYAPENTIPAFELALEQGADGFELDTMLSADGVPVVIHDRSVARTTNGVDRVDHLTVNELRSLDAGGWFSDAFSGTRIPLLEEVLDKFNAEGIINIELKNLHSPGDQLTELVLKLVERIKGFDRIIFSSYIPSNLKKVKDLHPEAKIGLLYNPGFFSKMKSIYVIQSLLPQYVHPHFSSCSTKFIEGQHESGRAVNTWTVSKEKLIKELWMRGVDGIITNDPKLAVQIKHGGV